MLVIQFRFILGSPVLQPYIRLVLLFVATFVESVGAARYAALFMRRRFLLLVGLRLTRFIVLIAASVATEGETPRLLRRAARARASYPVMASILYLSDSAYSESDVSILCPRKSVRECFDGCWPVLESLAFFIRWRFDTLGKNRAVWELPVALLDSAAFAGCNIVAVAVFDELRH